MSEPSQKDRLNASSTAADPLRALPSVDNIAVALKHDRTTETLPRIVASGRGAVAEQIVAVAQAQGIRVSKDPDLAEVLIALEVGSDIPVETFAAVAEILSYIYRANKIHGATTARSAQAELAADSPHLTTNKEA